VIASLLAAALLAQAAQAAQAAPAAPPPDDEIVVTGERPPEFRFHTKTDRRTGFRRCVLKRSSGDPLFDATVCQAALTCSATVETVKEAEACMATRMDDALKEWRKRRAAARAVR